MKSFRIRQAEYPMVGSALYKSLSENLTDFTTNFKTIDVAYADGFKKAVEDVQAVHAATTGLDAQKDVTRTLMDKQSALLNRLRFLKDYAFLADLDQKHVMEASKAFRKGDTEEGVKAVNRALAYYTANKEKLTSMSDNYLEEITALANEVEKLNVDQNAAMNFRSSLTKENLVKYDALDAYISTVSRLGKRVFKGVPKEIEFNISKILSRIRVAPRKEATEEGVAE